MTDFAIEIPLRTISVANAREHWRTRHRRVKGERRAAYLVTPLGLNAPCVVTLTRIAFNQLDDDNLRSALKAVRDGIADRLGVDDADPRVEWRYAQEKGKYRVYFVRIEIKGIK